MALDVSAVARIVLTASVSSTLLGGLFAEPTVTLIVPVVVERESIAGAKWKMRT